MADHNDRWSRDGVDRRTPRAPRSPEASGGAAGLRRRLKRPGVWLEQLGARWEGARLAARQRKRARPRPPRPHYMFPDRMDEARRRFRDRLAALRPPVAWRDSWLGPRALWAYAAGLLLIVSVPFALRQGVRPDPLQPPVPFSGAWWRYPVEWGAERRLATIPGEVRDLSPVPGSSSLWLAGVNGLARGGEGGGWVRVPAVMADPADPQAALKLGTSRGKGAGTLAARGTPAFVVLRFVTDSAAFAVVEPGYVVWSRDGGRSWSRLPGVPAVSTRPSLFVRGPSAAWLLCDEVVYRLSPAGLVAQPARLPGARALHFPTNSTGWAVGDSGRIWRTRDGGMHWQRQRSRSTANLSAVHFADARSGVAVGAAGAILYTRDGGARWSAASAAARVDLHAVHVDRHRGWAVGDEGTVLMTRSGGARWRAMRAGSSPLRFVYADGAGRAWTGGASGLFSGTARGEAWTRLAAEDATQVHSLEFVGNRLGFAVTSGGAVLKTRNEGRSWRTTHRAGVPLHVVEFASRTHGWIGGDGGRVLATRDGGLTWAAQVTERTEPIRALHFTSDSTGWAADAGGAVLSTRDGGRSWRMDALLEGFSPRGIHVQSATDGWLVGDHGRMARMRGGEWALVSPADLPVKVGTLNLAAVHFSDAQHGWVAGEAGILLRTADGGSRWTLHRTRVPGDLLSVHFRDAATGLVGGSGGRVLHTRDGGRVWTQQLLGDTVGSVRAVFAGTSGRWWAAGGRGAVFSSIRGRPWRDERGHAVFPPPWFYGVLTVFALLLAPAFFREAGSRRVMLAADRPLQAGEHDSMRLGELALALSRFIRNDATEAPLTIAVTGRWGSGKSSLMNLLRTDLKKHRYPIVAFNAWHHQKEESLLASLLENVRLQAIPMALSPTGLWYRLQMLGYRMKRHYLLSLLFLVSGGYGVGYFAQDFPDRLVMAMSPLVGLLQFRGPVGGLDKPFLSLVAVIPSLVALFRSLKGFGLDPARLVTSESGTFRRSELRAQAGFRHQFAAEFSDVTRALPNAIVIVVDDLDRCRPETLLELLEAINFLTSSGRCFVVMGLDRQLVRRYLAQTFTAVAREMTGEVNGEGTEHRKVRRRLAQRYLEKLIQVEVRIPEPTADQIREIMHPPQPARDARGPVRRALVHGGAVLRARYLVTGAAVLCVAVSVLGLRVSGVFRLPELVLPSPVGMVAEVVELPAGTLALPGVVASALTGTPSPGSPALPPVLVRANAPRQQPPPAPGSAVAPRGMFRRFMYGAARWGVLVLGCIGAVAAVWLLRRAVREPGSRVRDSSDVVRGLEICHPAIASCQPTPRTIKQFQRRVRYYVAREQAREARDAPFQGQGGPPAAAVRRIPDATLVALTMVESFFRNWLDDPRFPGDPRALLADLRLDPDTRRDQEFREFLAHYLKGVWVNAYLEDFRRLSSELADYRRARAKPVPTDGDPGTPGGPPLHTLN
jgi:photosystem II stability/assembly factor-like uncharacterized protein